MPRESRTLASLRDTLLPKLASGELRVNDAGRFLQERESWVRLRVSDLIEGICFHVCLRDRIVADNVPPATKRFTLPKANLSISR